MQHAQEIIDCKDKVIYQYGTDKYTNHFTLFKKCKSFDDRGRIWVRYNNHPLSLPLIDYSGKVELSQMDIVDGPIINANQVYNNCCDFKIFNGGYLGAIGGADIVLDTSINPVDYDGYPIYYVNGVPKVYYNDTYITVNESLIKKVKSSVNGFVSVVEMSIQNGSDYIKITASKDNNLAFEGWDIRDNQKYIGMYQHDGNIVLCSIINKTNTDENVYITPLDDCNGASGFRGIIRFNVFKSDKSVLIKEVEFRTAYDEYKFDIDDINYHNQWRLAEANNIISLVYEGEIIGVSGEFESYIENDQYTYMNAVKNRTGCIGGNTICTIDLIKNINYGYGEISSEYVNAEYFHKYSKLGMIGINA